MGWIGWSEADTLDTTMSGILLAYDGRMDLLKSIFGGGDSDTGSPGQAGGRAPKTKATPDNIRGALRMLGGGRRADTGKPSKPKGKPA